MVLVQQVSINTVLAGILVFVIDAVVDKGSDLHTGIVLEVVVLNASQTSLFVQIHEAVFYPIGVGKAFRGVFTEEVVFVAFLAFVC